MVDARYLQLFNSQYSASGSIRDMLYKAQRECFENNNMRTLVSKITMTMLSGDRDAVYPILGPNTTQKDFNEARFIMSTEAYTTLNFERYQLYDEGHVSDNCDDDDSNFKDNQPLSALAKFGVVITVAKSFNHGVEESMN